MLANPYQKYQNNAVMTATGPELTLMLYDGAIKFCNQSIEYTKDRDIANAHKCLIKAQNIIEELLITLDMRYDIAHEIEPLYKFILELLAEGNAKKDIRMIQDAIDLIRNFRDTWAVLIKKKA